MLDKIILAAAGTGGHIFPAVAVYEEIKSRNPDAEILFVGRKKDLKMGWFGEEIEFVSLPVKGIIGVGWRAVWSFILLIFSLLKCFWVFLRFKPKLVMGFGSYGSFVPVYMATVLGIPSAIHEQNVYPGVANRILGKRVDIVFLSFTPEEYKAGWKRFVVSGNPIRKEILKVKPKEKFSKNLLVLGGSQGSKTINRAIIDILPELTSMGISILHQTGYDHYSKVKEAYLKIVSKRHRVVPFIKDMASAYEWADLVVCRAGAMTISELTVVGRPSILIPFPHAAMNHQLKNAKYLQRNGAAFVVEEKDLLRVDLVKLLKGLFENTDRLKNMGLRAKSLGRSDAARIIVDELESVIEGKRYV